MSILLALVAGVVIGFAVLAPVVIHDRRRIKRLERRQQVHEFVIRHMAEAGNLPPEEPPPTVREFRIYKGAAAVGAVAMLVRQRPVRAVLAASTATAAAVLAVTLTPMQPQRGPSIGASRAPSSPAAAYGVQAAPRSPASSPPASVSRAAPIPAAQVSGTSGIAAPRPRLTASLPLLEVSVSLPPVLPTAVLPSLTVSLLPSVLSSPTVTAPAPSPSGSPAQACVVDLNLPSLLQMCVL